MISVRNVNKAFDQTLALNGLDMNVKCGSAYGLVGANGAGKTTILKLITGVLKPDSGDILIEDLPVYENEPVKRRMAFIPDDLAYFGKYNPKDLRRFYASLYERWNDFLFWQVLGEFNLAKNIPLSRFSKGMQKQTAFALVLAAEPDYLILDEPVDGLDPIAKKIVWYYIMYAIKNRQMTVLVSSHNLRELEGICDSVGIINDGRMVLERELNEMRTDIHKLQISFGSSASFTGEMNDSLTPENAYEGLNIIHMERRGAVDIIIVRDAKDKLENWAGELRPVLFDPIPLTLEEVFIYELGGADRANSVIFE
jgi:ABC-2 type transport system ATP-binding protein